MIRHIPLSKTLNYLTCPFCPRPNGTTLKGEKGALRCSVCKRKYKITSNIIEFVRPGDLDSETARELRGNTFKLTRENIKHYENKDKWSNYYNHFVEKKMNLLLNKLKKIRKSGIVSLGSGPGFEIKQLLKRKKLKTIFSSDLAYSATRVVPHTLKSYRINLCLFTSDLNRPPVRQDVNFPIVIYEALHHTGDMVATIEKFLERNYKHILFVEPSTNFLVRIMAKLGLAERVEYSGLKPEFLDLNKLKTVAEKYDYQISVDTIWEVPEDYFRIFCKKEGIVQNLLVGLIDLTTYVGNFFKFGNFAIVSLERQDAKR